MTEQSKEIFINEFHQGIKEEQFVLYLQPKYHMQTDSVYGAEVLVRWQHPVKGLLEPKDFLPQCVAYGVMCELDYYVWDHSCRLLHNWKEEGKTLYVLSVKVTRSSLYHSKIGDWLLELLDQYQVEKEYIQLEIEEDSIRADIYQAQEAINYLHELGFTILLDDFSYGCSSISVLNQVDVDILKVDMKFFSDCNNTRRGEVILSSLIKSVTWLGMSVLAECIETQQQKNFAMTSGCDYIQGFFFSKPVDASAFEDLVHREEEKRLQMMEPERENNPAHDLRILVIDDDEIERELLFKYLNDDFYIHLSDSAENGLKYLNQHKEQVDMVLIDYMMPGMDGVDFLKYCALDNQLQVIPKIMITSSERANDQVRAFEAGAYDYLMKPLIPELVKVRIRHAMELNHKLQRTEHEKQVFEHQAQVDKATGILNKIAFQSKVEQYLSLKNGNHNALLIVDIDDFKDVNDTYGHLMGDEVIKLIAAELTSNFRASDYVGRFGGDEFTVFMMDVSDEALVEKKADEIIEYVKIKSVNKLDIPVSVSVGVGYSTQTDDFMELFERTDGVLYQAKSAGKGRFISTKWR